MNKDASGQVSEDLRKVLSSHGYGFQYAVLRRTNELVTAHRCIWRLEGVEFPVTVGGNTAHIDFVLTSRSGQSLLVAECKRTDPARSRWVFVKAPFTWSNPRLGEVLFDQFVYRPGFVITEDLCTGFTDKDVCHIGFELRTGSRGEGVSAGHSAINQAVTQVLRGSSGLLNYTLSKARLSDREQLFRFIPAIFTTAELWVSDVDLGSADLVTGNVPKELVKTRQVDWIWFTHNRSPAIQPDTGSRQRTLDLARALREEFARSVAIVSSSGLDGFLSADLESWLE